MSQKSFKEGQAVHVPTYRMKGVVTGVRKDGVEVQLGSVRVWLKPLEVTLLDDHASNAGRVNYRLPTDLVSAPEELDTHALTVEEAIAQLESFLDEAHLGGLTRVRVNHGKGTGALKRAIHAHLKEDPLVDRFETAGLHEGSYGVTVVYLRESRKK